MGGFFKNMKADTALKLMLLAWWVANLLQASFTELANDEAYYWVFAQSLDWGYFDHPPMTALLVWLGNLLGGEVGVRLFFTVLQPVYLYIIWMLVRPEKPEERTARDASLFFLICAAMPILQLYGFIAVPDAPLMLFTALFLLTFKRFMQRDSWMNAIYIGIVMACLAYSKYHGALVVILALLSAPRILLRPKFYVGALVAVALLLPHLNWQWEHDWASFRYHLAGRNGYFRWSYVTEFVMNLALIFNPLFFPLYFVGWRRGGGAVSTVVRRAMRFIVVGFVVFFLVSSFRGYVQPQCVIPITFGLIMVLFRYARTSRRVERYVRTVAWIVIGLVALVRIEMIFNPLGIKFEVFDNRTSYSQIAAVADGRPVIFGGSYAIASKYMFYTGGEAYSQPSINYRTSQWQFLDNDTRAAGSPVIVEVAPEYADNVIELANGRTFGWREIDDFRPVRLVNMDIDGVVPEEVTYGDEITLSLRLHNPYPYDISVSPDVTPPVTARLVMVWGRNKERFQGFVMPAAVFTIPAGGTAAYDVLFTVPRVLPALDNYRVGFVLEYGDVGYWFNSPELHTDIVDAPLTDR